MEDGSANGNNHEGHGMFRSASDTPSCTGGVLSGAADVRLQLFEYECAAVKHIPADRKHGQFADHEDLKNGMLDLSSRLAGFSITCRKPNNTTLFSAETSDVMASTTRALSEGLRKIDGEATSAAGAWNPEALTGRLQALRSQMCSELDSLV